ncbi:phosphoglucosamine mutase [Thiomicrorhabdus heinhorstiae]|uniref:Phosphoglucosamine mutase n=1 Tax=Thiomicrorhabdus heinhorstiae TaxID=2748010 RepID=A0ABS0BVC2_9GAMM|nr:phosphoglucosamine mutase [Thiomicrorhabdus heinhorstiae]MBF6057294.1 phosphoglucosamine mutase [Thiomicrorhabdus heinhorstiae]
MSQQRKYFGTDGIRNRVGQGMLRPDEILKLGWATGRVMKRQGARRVMIGKDTRISGYMFESALEAGFIAAGIDVYLLGPMPTPAVAYLTQTLHADMGIVISASHNPHYDNGIKFFSAEGKKISDEMEMAIEAALEEEMDVVSSEKLGKAKRIDDAAGRYIEFCKSTYKAPLKLDGLNIVVDCSQGATYHIAPHVFRELGAEVASIGIHPDGMNINQGCGATHLDALQEAVVASNADLGIAFDGDGDRVMMVDKEGKVIDGDLILYIIATQQKKKVAGVVGTVMSNLGVEKAFKRQGIDFLRAKVGDRFVMETLVENGWNFGAEPSGHVLCLHKTTTGDGIVAALQVLAAMRYQQKGLDELCEDVALFPQILRNVSVEDASQLADNAPLQEKVRQLESEYGDALRILIRASGTEPLIRVMVEGEERTSVEAVADSLVSVVRSEFS